MTAVSTGGVLLLLSLACPRLTAAQQTTTLRGLVIDSVQREPISLTVVELANFGSTLTAADGTFSFANIPPGEYTLRVRAFGYLPSIQSIDLQEGRTVEIRLDPGPLALDSVVVSVSPIDVGGRVRDPAKDYLLVDAEVLTDQGHLEATDAHGEFRLRRVWEDVPLHIRVRAFSYLPVDTIVFPTRGDEYRLDVVEDPLVVRRLRAWSGEMEERARPRFAPFFPNMDREEIQRYAGRHTLRTLLEFRAGPHLNRIVAVIVDGRRYDYSDDPVSELSGLLPEEIQRLEFRYAGVKAVVLVVYTRDWVGRRLGR